MKKNVGLTAFVRVGVLATCMVIWAQGALSQTRTPDSVSENFQPPLNIIPGFCLSDPNVLIDGIIPQVGYCVTTPVPPTYRLSFHLDNPNPDEYFADLRFWPNAGNAFGDSELRVFDVVVDYLDSTGSPAQLSATGVNLGDTTGPTDVKIVPFGSLGWPGAISGISKITLSNLGDMPVEAPFREFSVGRASPEISLVKTATLNDGGDGVANFGDTISYVYTVTNSGIPTLFNVGLSEDASNFTGTGTLPVPAYSSGGNDYDNGVGTDTDLRQGETVTFVAEYTLTEVDITAGLVTNQASVSGNDFVGVSANDDSGTANDNDTPTTLGISASPAISVVKSADDTTERAVGEIVEYTYVVTNTGNVPLTAVSLLDVHNAAGAVPTPTGETLSSDVGTSGNSIDSGVDGVWDVLAAGDSVTFTGTYTVQQSDIDNLQ